MISEYIWIELYLQGYSLDCSDDGKNYYPINKEPYAGDGKYYRRALNESYPVPIQSEQYLSHSHTH